jgi:DNA polymerase-1
MCEIDRDAAKNINFGLAYNMGEVKLAASLNRSLEEARVLFTQYHNRLPFVKSLQTTVAGVALTRGYIRTILGRRARFELWEPRWRDYDESSVTPLPFKQACSKWGENKIRRAFSHKALNRLIQGSAADVMKMAMSKIGKSGVCSVLGAPHLTVHDELDWSIPRTKIAREAHDEVINIMQSAVKFKIPIICDSESGPNWGEAT